MFNLFISAARKSSGKTSFSIALTALLRAQGHSVRTFKKGPDYIDPMWLSKASGHACINLDFYTMSHDEIKRAYSRYSRGADVVIVEGNKGLYDGMDVEGRDCSAALAKLLGLPVILVLDVNGITRGVAALLHGYRTFDQSLRIAGVVLNKVGGDRHEQKLRDALARYSDVPVLGAIHRIPEMKIEERHIGLIPSNEDRGAGRRIEMMARVVAGSVVIRKLLSLAATPKESPAGGVPSPAGRTAETVRLGIARDQAFAFYYPDDFTVMESLGAELVFIDTLRDAALPDIDALFIGGGFPEFYLQALQRNSTLRADIKRFIEAGYPVYAECGGLMYLCRDVTYRGATHEMVGIFNASVQMQTKPVGRGYVQLVETAKHPWAAVNAETDETLPAHEFHYSRLENLSDDVEFAYRVTRGVGIKDGFDGLIYKNTLATYTHHRNVGKNHWAERFIAHIQRTKQGFDEPVSKAKG